MIPERPPQMPWLHPVVAEVLQRKSAYLLDFEDGNQYDSLMVHAYSRTVADVNTIGANLDIIEFGCFTGIVSASLSRLGHRLTASDIQFVLADLNNSSFLASESIKAVPHDLAASPLPFSSESFDVIVFTEVLEHLNFNPLPLLSEFHRILRPKGVVYLTTPNLVSASNRMLMIKGTSFMNPVEHLRWNLKPATGMSVGLHWREWTKEELVELFSESGFALKHHNYMLLSPNQSGFPRKQLVSAMYSLLPSLMPGQVAVFTKSSS
jgi:2-polyprenyl-3-methyl-5-hydroxy-6-metoxy-1,4-benzoquinol methylase